MSGTDAIIGLIVSVFVIGYLVVALLFPEKL